MFVLERETFQGFPRRSVILLLQGTGFYSWSFTLSHARKQLRRIAPLQYQKKKATRSKEDFLDIDVLI